MSCERCGSQTSRPRLCRECALLESVENEAAHRDAPPLYECNQCGEERAESPDSTCWLCKSDRHEVGDDGRPEARTDGGKEVGSGDHQKLRLTDEGLEVPDELVGTTRTVVVEKPNIAMRVSFTGSGAGEFSDHLLSFPTDEDEERGDVPQGCVRIEGTLYDVVDERSLQECPECGSSSVSPRSEPPHCYTCDTDLHGEQLVTDGGEEVGHGGPHIDWPDEFPRTDPEDREPYSGGFRVTRSTAFQNVLDELQTWDGVTDVQLDSGAEHQKRNPNKPYANASYEDPGVVVRFNKDGQDMAAACDRWDNPRDNAQDLYRYLHETRMQEQRGTVTAESEYQKLRLPSGDEDTTVAAPPAHAVLGVERDASEAEIRSAYQERLKETHPDQGGSAEALQRVRDAYEVLVDGE